MRSFATVPLRNSIRPHCSHTHANHTWLITFWILLESFSIKNTKGLVNLAPLAPLSTCWYSLNPTYHGVHNYNSKTVQNTLISSWALVYACLIPISPTLTTLWNNPTIHCHFCWVVLSIICFPYTVRKPIMVTTYLNFVCDHSSKRDSLTLDLKSGVFNWAQICTALGHYHLTLMTVQVPVQQLPGKELTKYY